MIALLRIIFIIVGISVDNRVWFIVTSRRVCAGSVPGVGRLVTVEEWCV